MSKKYYIGTLVECNDLVGRLNARYNYPTADGKTITVASVEKAEYSNDHKAGLKLSVYNDLTELEKAKCVSLLPAQFIKKDD